MLEDFVTEAARRALARAAALADRCSASSREPLHLLWAVALDDSEAAEALRGEGVTLERLEQLCPLPRPADAQGEDLAQEIQSRSSDLPDSPDFRRVLAAAAQAATLRGRETEVGTGDLLTALGSVESAASRALAELNFRPQSVFGWQADSAQPPIDIDFQIDWREAPATDQTATFRILDAAANRAREGLRVLEDFARFALDDAHLTRRLKECRHALREALAKLPAEALLRSRDTQSDIGTTISTLAETVRKSPADVARAGFKRAQEAVRSLEEFGKLLSPVAAARFERLRYELYTLEKGLSLTEFNRRELEDRRLYLLATEALCPHGLGPAVRSALAGGVGIVQLREKEMPERRLLELGRRVRVWTREAGALFIMNDRPDLAVATDADGVHVGQDELPVKQARAIVGPHRLVGVSTHTLEQARQAVLDGADYIGVGPCFPSATKSFASLAGLDLVRQVAGEVSLPWFAIGGINQENIAAVVEAGATRIAVSQAILGADDPAAVAQTLGERLSAAAARVAGPREGGAP
jgi:thiamine-phosphate pyrophosphorylase